MIYPVHLRRLWFYLTQVSDFCEIFFLIILNLEVSYFIRMQFIPLG